MSTLRIALRGVMTIACLTAATAHGQVAGGQLFGAQAAPRPSLTKAEQEREEYLAAVRLHIADVLANDPLQRASAKASEGTRGGLIARGAEGTRGGGQVVRMNDRWVLRDIVDPTTCRDAFGDDVFAQVPRMREVLGRIAQLDWYFAFDLEREMRALDYCFTNFLAPTRTEDHPWYRISTVAVGSGRMAAVRFGRGVYFEDRIFQEMKRFDETHPNEVPTLAFLMLHETLHSYLWLHDPMRNQHLRNMGRVLHDVYVDQIRTRANLHLPMRKNAVQFPREVAKLDPHRAYVEFAAGRPEARRRTILGIDDLQKFLEPKEIEPSSLLYQDFAAIAALGRDVYGSALREFCLSQDREVITAVGNRPEVKSFDLALLCLSDAPAESDPAFKSYLLRTAGYERQFAALYARLSAKQASIAQRRISANEALTLISISGMPVGRQTRPVGELMPVRANSWDQLPSDFRALPETIATLILDGQLERVLRLTSGDPAFYEAFGTQPLLDAIQALPAPVAEDRAVARDAVETLFTTYWQQSLLRIRTRLGADAETKLAPWLVTIDARMLGYTIR
jgi:hypothetical protein